MEISNFLKRGVYKSTLSQIILPFCSDANEESIPIALLSGNINLKSSLKKNGQAVSLEEELKILYSELQLRTMHPVKGTIIDLSSEMKKLEIETASDEKEIEIKEEWTEVDEVLFRNRIPRAVTEIEIKPVKHLKQQEISEDIDELLRLAELEEEKEEELESNKSASKIQIIKNEVKDQVLKPKALGKSLILPKISATNPLIGEVIERESEPVFRKKTASLMVDQVSSRIILNDLKRADLKSSANKVFDEKESISDIPSSVPLKKSSLFSLRKENPQ